MDSRHRQDSQRHITGERALTNILDLRQDRSQRFVGIAFQFREDQFGGLCGLHTGQCRLAICRGGQRKAFPDARHRTQPLRADNLVNEEHGRSF